MSSLRVAMIIQGYHPRVGGAERQLAALAPLLQAREIEVHVLTRRYPGLAAEETIAGVPVHRLPIPGPKAMASMVFTFTALEVLRRLRPQVVHAHELFSPATTAVAAKREFHIPVVVKILRGGVQGDVNRLKSKTFGTQRIATFRNEVDAFAVISQEIDRELAEVGMPPEKRVFIPNGVDLGRFTPLDAPAKAALRVQLKLPEGPLAVFTGRLAPEKRVDQLVQIWPAVRAQHSTANLVVVGDGDLRASLEQAAGPGVVFAGQQEDVAPYLRAADAFVLPSAAEGLSNALLEGMASGLPVIATNVGGAPDLIDHGRSGWLVQPDHPTEIQTALITLWNNPDESALMGERGRARVAADYSLAATADKLRRLYDRLSASGK